MKGEHDMTNTTTNDGTMNTQPTASPKRFDTGLAALWASAFVIAGMLLSHAGRTSIEPTAHADVSEVADLTVVTAPAGSNWDIMALLDRREEVLYVYGLGGNRSVELYQVQKLDEAFTQAAR